MFSNMVASIFLQQQYLLQSILIIMLKIQNTMTMNPFFEDTIAKCLFCVQQTMFFSLYFIMSSHVINCAHKSKVVLSFDLSINNDVFHQIIMIDSYTGAEKGQPPFSLKVPQFICDVSSSELVYLSPSCTSCVIHSSILCYPLKLDNCNWYFMALTQTFPVVLEVLIHL